MATPLRPVKLPVQPPVRRKSSSFPIWLVYLIVAVFCGGGMYYYVQEQDRIRQEEQAKRAEAERLAEAQRAERRRVAEEAARKRREAEEAAAAARAAEEERMRRGAEEAERARRAAEEAERLRRLKEQQKTEEPTPEPEPEPTPEPEPQEKPAGVYDAEFPLVGPDCNLPVHKKTFEDMVENLLAKHDFSDFSAAFGKRIRTCLPELIIGDKLSHSAYKRCVNLGQAIDLCLLIDMAGGEKMTALFTPGAKEYANGPDAPANFMRWALRDKTQPLHTLMQSFMMNEGDPANAAYAIETFFRLWDATPERQRAEYLNLAIACSLVSPQRAKAPSSLLKQTEPPLSIYQLYAYYREMNAAKKLATDIRKLSVSQLLYVVDVRLPRSEFDWVQKNLTYAQAKWGEAYGSIRYRMDRAAQGVNPYKEYTFAELRREGGVCRDQAYFAVNTAKCKGIPAVYITGDGDRGPHAWIATLIDDVNWQQTASYGYRTGRFSNTCSGRAQHESVLLNQTKKTTDEKMEKAADGMLLSAYMLRLNCTEEARGAAKFVTSAYPLLTAAWSNRIHVLSADEEKMPPTETWRKISAELMRHGRKNGELIDLAAEVEDAYLMDSKSTSAQKSAMARNMRTLERTVGSGRSDLLLEAIERQGKLYSENGDLRGLAAFYKKQLKEHTDRGDIFQQILAQYSRFLGEDATEKHWKTMAQDAEKLFEKHVRSGGGDYFKLKKEVAIQHLIAEAYDKAGETKKAAKIHADADARLKKSSDRYQPES